MSVEEREQRWTEAMHAERRGKAVAYERILKEVATVPRRPLAPSLLESITMRSDTSFGRMQLSQPAHGAVIRISHARDSESRIDDRGRA